MAIKANAKRAIRVSERKRLFNVRRLSTMRDETKTIKKLVLAGDFAAAEKAISTAYKAIDKAAKRGVIKDNTASRKKSRLVAFVVKAKAVAATAEPKAAKVKAVKAEKSTKVYVKSTKASKTPKAEKVTKK